MKFLRHPLCFITLLVMLAAQAAVFQHAARHFTENGDFASLQADHENHLSHKQPETPQSHHETCQLCLSAHKNLASSLTADSFVFIPVQHSTAVIPNTYAYSALPQYKALSYRSRAPPIFLS